MLYTGTTPTQRRRRLREDLRRRRCARLIGAFTPLSARLVQRAGFEGVYLSGAVTSAELALPDIGLTTATEVADRARAVARACDLPLLVDADTGFGPPGAVARTVQELEDAGAAGCHIEDQVDPKRCGHLAGKRVVDDAAAAARIAAALAGRREADFTIVARTDIRAVADLDATIARARLLACAGADAVFPEALASAEEYAAVADALDVPIVVNMTEFGRGPVLDHATLADIGVGAVIHPVTLLRLAMGAARDGLETLAREGRVDALLARMQTRAELYDLLDYTAYAEFDSHYDGWAEDAAGPATPSGRHEGAGTPDDAEDHESPEVADDAGCARAHGADDAGREST